jgi:hypothetical protein
MQGEAERALRCRPPSLRKGIHFDADSIDAAIPRLKPSLVVRTLVAHEPRHHVYSVRLSFLPQLRDKRLRDAFRQQCLERGEFGAFPLTAHRGSLSQLIPDGQVHPRRRPSVGMIPRITGGLDSTGCSDHRISLAESSGATCWPRTIGPAQREQRSEVSCLTASSACVGLLGRNFSASDPTYSGPRLIQRNAPTDLKKMMTETNHAKVVGGGEKPRNSDVCKLEPMASRAASSAWPSRHA